jgi:pimeloyl-ACP methyl ester carboxylesterase
VLRANETITLPDKRQLGYFTIDRGGSGGVPVVYFHGTASSRLEALLLEQVSLRKIELIAVDRPGYGLSTYNPRKTLQDFNNDLNYLINHLGLAQFNVLGWSGGSVFAIAYMTSFPQKVRRGIIVSAPNLPFDPAVAHNTPFAKYAMKLPAIGSIVMRNMQRQILKANTPKAFLQSTQGKQMLHACSKNDLTFFSNPKWIKLLHQSIAEAFRQKNSVKTIIEEHTLFLKPCNLSICEIGDKLQIWHGKEDKTCPINNAYQIAHKFKGAKLKIFSNKGHYFIFDHLDQIAQSLTENI